MTNVAGVTYTWDYNGNLLDDGVRTYEYDYANRLVAVVSGTLTTTFTYNGDGHRVAKHVDGVTTTYVVAVLGLSQPPSPSTTWMPPSPIARASAM